MITRVSPLSLAVPKTMDTGISKTVFWMLIAAFGVIVFYVLYVLNKHKKQQNMEQEAIKKNLAAYMAKATLVQTEQDAIKENLSANVAKTDIAYEALEKVVATPEVTAILVKNNQLSADVVQSTSANNTQLLQPVIVGRG